MRRAPLGRQVVIEEETRSGKQNARMWAMITDVARAGIEYAGRDTWDTNDWKRWLVSGFITAKMHEERQGATYIQRFVRGIEGELVQIDELSTRYWSKSRMAEFISYVEAWGTAKGVEWTPYGEEPL